MSNKKYFSSSFNSCATTTNTSTYSLPTYLLALTTTTTSYFLSYYYYAHNRKSERFRRFDVSRFVEKSSTMATNEILVREVRYTRKELKKNIS